MRVLLIEDDSATAKSIELMLRAEGFSLSATDLGEESVDLGKIYDYDLILLDLSLPDMSGLDVLRQLRAARINTPIMILSGSTEIDTKVKTFSGGADDYLTKPFHKDEMIARIHAVVRRSQGHAQSVIITGDIRVNLGAKTTEVNGARVHLTGKESQMLELLSLRKGATITKEMFLNHLYGGLDEPELKIIDVFICKIRKKLREATGGHDYIETVWGPGLCATRSSGHGRRRLGGLIARTPERPRSTRNLLKRLRLTRLISAWLNPDGLPSRARLHAIVCGRQYCALPSFHRYLGFIF